MNAVTVAATSSPLLSHQPKYILLAEDDVDDQELLIETLTGLEPSLTVLPINNGHKVLEHLEGLADDALPSLLILDFNLPGMDGGQILKALAQKQRYASLRKIVWSTSGADIYQRKCLEMGASAYFTKPSDINRFGEMCKEILQFCEPVK